MKSFNGVRLAIGQAVSTKYNGKGTVAALEEGTHDVQVKLTAGTVNRETGVPLAADELRWLHCSDVWVIKPTE